VQIGEFQSSVVAEFVSTSAAGGTGDGGSSVGTPTDPGQPTCTVAGAGASVGTFVPIAKPGQVVPGIRAKVGVYGPSSVQVTGTLVYGAGKSRRVDLGARSYHGTGERNLRFALPAAVRSELPLGATAWVSLAVAATPDSAQGCATHGAVTHKLKLKIVKVLSSPQAGVS
jgi:hypothetical protein